MKYMKRKPQETELAYLNEDFMHSPDARPLRILSEYLYPRQVFKKFNIKDTIVFYGSARTKSPAQLRRFERDLAATGELTANDYKRLAKAKLMTRYYQDATRLAYRITRWSKGLSKGSKRFMICSGGGPGIMEASNRGASLARGLSIGLNIDLPFEQSPNPYITPSLSLDFNYFFMRKYWFVYLAKALVIFPGGFGTLDELFELLTLVQTKKVAKKIPIVIYGREFWESIVNFEMLVEWGTISEEDMKLIYFSDHVDEAFEYIVKRLHELYLTPESKGSVLTE